MSRRSLSSYRLFQARACRSSLVIERSRSVRAASASAMSNEWVIAARYDSAEFTSRVAVATAVRAIAACVAFGVVGDALQLRGLGADDRELLVDGHVEGFELQEALHLGAGFGDDPRRGRHLAFRLHEITGRGRVTAQEEPVATHERRDDEHAREQHTRAPAGPVRDVSSRTPARLGSPGRRPAGHLAPGHRATGHRIANGLGLERAIGAGLDPAARWGCRGRGTARRPTGSTGRRTPRRVGGPRARRCRHGAQVRAAPVADRGRSRGLQRGSHRRSSHRETAR